MLKDDTAQPGKLTLVPGGKEPRRRLLVLKRSTHEDNCSILTDLRDIARTQIALLKTRAYQDVFTVQQADVLVKLSKVFQTLSGETDKEHAKYDFSDISTGAMENLLALSDDSGNKVT